MSEIDEKKINQEGCAWIAKMHDSEPSPQELAEFRAWVAQSPAHKQEILKLSKLWGELNVLTELAVAVESPARTALQAPAFSLAGSYKWLGAVACTLVLFGVFLLLPDFKQAEVGAPAFMAYQTSLGEQRLVNLDDGSTILLNTNSKLQVHYGERERTIYLHRGQAHFQVVSDPQKPFRVYSGRGMIRTLGTAFTVYLKGSLLEVTVTEGAVEFNAVIPTDLSPNQSNKVARTDNIERLAVLRAQQNALFDADVRSIQQIETITSDEIAKKLSWREGVLRFAGDPLQDVVEEIGRYTDLSVVILDPSIRDLRIGGLFKVGEAEKLFEALEASFGVKVERINEKVVHLVAAES